MLSKISYKMFLDVTHMSYECKTIRINDRKMFASFTAGNILLLHEAI